MGTDGPERGAVLASGKRLPHDRAEGESQRPRRRKAGAGFARVGEKPARNAPNGRVTTPHFKIESKVKTNEAKI
jgi:hypothetical protein